MKEMGRWFTKETPIRNLEGGAYMRISVTPKVIAHTPRVQSKGQCKQLRGGFASTNY